MASSNTAETQAEREAADWFAKLNSRKITTPALEAFYAWRREPQNDLAYGRMERIWEAGEQLKADPATARQVADALSRGGRHRRGQTWLRVMIPVGGLALAGAIAAYLSFTSGLETYSTPVGEQRLVALADGSRVRLDTDTRLQVRFQRGERDVQLVKGRAFFDVAHDPTRPFIVEADGAKVRAVGTRFDVRLTGAHPQVTLVEGAVEVTQAHDGQLKSWRLAPGQALRPAQPAPTPVAVDVAVATSWTSGQLVFHATPLSEAVAEVNRYSKTKIVLDDAPLAARPVSGKFDVGDTQAFVAAVCDLFELSPTLGDDEIRLRPKA